MHIVESFLHIDTYTMARMFCVLSSIIRIVVCVIAIGRVVSKEYVIEELFNNNVIL